MNKTEEYPKSVRFTKAINGKFTSLAVKLSREKSTIFRQMVKYFHRAKKDSANNHCTIG